MQYATATKILHDTYSLIRKIFKFLWDFFLYGTFSVLSYSAASLILSYQTINTPMHFALYMPKYKSIFNGAKLGVAPVAR